MIVVRTTSAGTTELLMGLRGAKHRFMPNRLVFPGGKVDPGDHHAPAASDLRPDVARLLQRAAGPRLARALAMAAARELEEESGLSLGNPPRLDGLDYLCRAMTPRASPIRFNARFFVLDADQVGGALAGSGELEALRFVPLPTASGLDLATVTKKVIDQLQLFLALDRDRRASRQATPLLRERDWESE